MLSLLRTWQRVARHKMRNVGEEVMKTYLEFSDVELMEQAASCLRDRLLIRLLFRLGCRVSEALALVRGLGKP